MSRFTQLIKAFSNLSAIYEGIKNRIFVNKKVEEIGWFFNEIKTIQNDLSQFKKNNN